MKKEIIERLLEAKHITIKEAIVLLEKEDRTIPYGINPWVQPYNAKPYRPNGPYIDPIWYTV